MGMNDYSCTIHILLLFVILLICTGCDQCKDMEQKNSEEIEEISISLKKTSDELNEENRSVEDLQKQVAELQATSKKHLADSESRQLDALAIPYKLMQQGNFAEAQQALEWISKFFPKTEASVAAELSLDMIKQLQKPSKAYIYSDVKMYSKPDPKSEVIANFAIGDEVEFYYATPFEYESPTEDDITFFHVEGKERVGYIKEGVFARLKPPITGERFTDYAHRIFGSTHIYSFEKENEDDFYSETHHSLYGAGVECHYHTGGEAYVVQEYISIPFLPLKEASMLLLQMKWSDIDIENSDLPFEETDIEKADKENPELTHYYSYSDDVLSFGKDFWGCRVEIKSNKTIIGCSGGD